MYCLSIRKWKARSCNKLVMVISKWSMSFIFRIASLVPGDNLKISPMPVKHYDDVIMTTVASQITSLTIVYSTVYSGADQSKHQSSASLAFVCGIHRGPVNSPHKWPVTRKMFPFDDVIMNIPEGYGYNRHVIINNKTQQSMTCVHISWDVLDHTDHLCLTRGIYALHTEQWHLTAVTQTQSLYHMMASRHMNVLRFTGRLWGKSTGRRWIPLTESTVI